MERSDQSPDDFLASIDDSRREAMVSLDATITAAMPDRSRTLWRGVFWGGTDQSIIGYGDMIQQRPRGQVVEWFVVGLALQKRNFSLYVNAVLDGAYLGGSYADRLGVGGKVKVGAASLGFTSIDKIDLDVLAEMCAHANRLSPATDAENAL